MAEYKEIAIGGTVVGYLRTADGAVIPANDGNRDFVEMIRLRNAGQVQVDPADPAPQEPTQIVAAKRVFFDTRRPPQERLDSLAVFLGFAAPSEAASATPAAPRARP